MTVVENFTLPYSAMSLTEKVNRIHSNWGLLDSLGLAPFEQHETTQVRLDFHDGEIFVLGARARGAPGQHAGSRTERAVKFEIPHFPMIQKVLIGDVDGLVDTNNGKIVMRTLNKTLKNNMDDARAHHSVTLEWARAGMLKGRITDGDGNLLYDLFERFGIDKKIIEFKLSDSNFDVTATCSAIFNHMKRSLIGQPMNGVNCIVSTEFFDQFIKHPNVEKYWIQAQNAALHTTVSRANTENDWGRRFKFDKITFIENVTVIPFKDTQGKVANKDLVEEGFGHAYPTGTRNLFRTHEAPPAHIRQLNKLPKQDTLLLTTKNLDHGEGYELKTQSNRIALCKQPQVLVEVRLG